MRAIRNREIVVRLHVDDEGGALVAADTTPTLTVTNGSGDVVSGVSAVTSETTGVYKAIIPPQSDLDVLTITWQAVVDGHTRTSETTAVVVSERLVPLWRLREDPELAGLSAPNLLRLADAVESWFNNALGFPYCEEPLHTVFNHPGGSRLIVPGALYPRRMVRAIEGETEVPADRLAEVEVVDGAFEFTAFIHWDFLVGQHQMVWAMGRKEVWITHGPSPEFDHGVPADLVNAAVTLARYVARGSNYPERARSVQTESAIISFSTPSWDRPTGLPEVDGAVNRYAVRRVV